MILISHPATKGYSEKPLDIHLHNVASNASEYIQRLSLNLSLIDPHLLSNLAFKVGLMHDLGKASSYFQAYIRGGQRTNLTHHSFVSAIITYINIGKNVRLGKYAPLAFKAVQKHHSNLSSFFNDNLDSNALIDETLSIYKNLVQQIANYKPLALLLQENEIVLTDLDRRILKRVASEIDDYEPAYQIDDSIELFLLQNLLFSVLTDADKHDAANLLSDSTEDPLIKMNYSPQQAISAKTADNSEINKIRTSFLNSIQHNTDIALETKLYSMTAPTGSGKTYACMAFAANLQKKLERNRRLIYCLPYTSIIDQNFAEFEKVIELNIAIPEGEKHKYLIKQHHLVDYYHKGEDNPDYDYNDYLKDILVAESWSSACVISTFVQLFHSIIGNRNSMVRKLHNIMNSIIILDEVQSLPAKYYPLIRQVFKVLGDRFGTYILTCTATQPFIYEHGTYKELCSGLDFSFAVFNRVQVQIISGVYTIDSFCESFLDLENAKNALFVMNTKKSAIALYELICKKYGEEYEVICLTTLHLPIHRQGIIEYLKEGLSVGKPLILVSTQLIEAGVDLSFCKVFRDFSPLDSIVQVAGRCNRHGELGELGGKMYLVTFSDERGEYCQRVYDRYLLSKTKDCLRAYNDITSIQFADLIWEYYNSLDIGAAGRAILNAISSMNYDQDMDKQIPVRKFQLIEDQYATEIVFVLSDTASEIAMNTILESREFLKDSSISKARASQIQLLMAGAYHKLSHYQLNLSYSETSNYSNSMSFFNRLADHVYYISMCDVEIAYSLSTGFCITPSDSGGCLAL